MIEEMTVSPATEPVWVWGVPLAPVTMGGAIDEVERRIDARRPCYLVSANLNYAMLCERHPELDAINRRAALVLVDGMPMVWASRLGPRPLTERVAGSDLVFALAELAGRRGFGIYFLGGEPGVAEAAAVALRDLYPGLRIAGVESPPFGPMDPKDEAAMIGRIRDSGADILLVAFGQPKGEEWIAAHHRATGASISIQIGASLDFAAGRVRRAPMWIRRSGLEWLFRLALEPRRLAGRYSRNIAFLGRCLVRDFKSRNQPAIASRPGEAAP